MNERPFNGPDDPVAGAGENDRARRRCGSRNWTSALIIRALRRWRDLREGSHRGPAAVVGFDFSFGPGLLIS